MVEAAERLLTLRGVEGASLSEVLKAADAPKGSVYYHFPDGKDQLISEALDLARARYIAHVEGLQDPTPELITRRFLAGWRELIEQTGCTAGCPVVAATAAGPPNDVLSHADAAFGTWIARLAELFEEAGVGHAESVRFSTTLVAASEGAIAMTRARGTLDPFDTVADELIRASVELQRRGGGVSDTADM